MKIFDNRRLPPSEKEGGEQAVALCALVPEAFWHSPPFTQEGCVPFAVSRIPIRKLNTPASELTRARRAARPNPNTKPKVILVVNFGVLGAFCRRRTEPRQ